LSTTTVPRIVALTAFYDEPPAMIASMLNGLARLRVDHVVALDGAYRLYPDGKPASHPDVWQAFLGAFAFGIGVTLIAPNEVWEGNEVEKRTALFRHGLAHARPGRDWFLVCDCDEFFCVDVPDLRDRLAATEHDAASVHVYDVAARRTNGTVEQEFDTRRFYRAQEIRVGPNHFTYRTTDGRVLWASSNPIEEPALDLTGVVAFEHHPGLREAARLAAKWAYYTQRDETAVERGWCIRCGERAVVRLPERWQLREGQPITNFAEFCHVHAVEADRANYRRLYAMGFDPDTLRVRETYPPSDTATAVTAVTA
jgi:hypothetical protein